MIIKLFKIIVTITFLKTLTVIKVKKLRKEYINFLINVLKTFIIDFLILLTGYNFPKHYLKTNN